MQIAPLLTMVPVTFYRDGRIMKECSVHEMNLGVPYSCHTFNALLQVAKWYNNVSCVDPNQIHEKRRRPLRKARV